MLATFKRRVLVMTVYAGYIQKKSPLVVVMTVYAGHIQKKSLVVMTVYAGHIQKKSPDLCMYSFPHNPSSLQLSEVSGFVLTS